MAFRKIDNIIFKNKSQTQNTVYPLRKLEDMAGPEQIFSYVFLGIVLIAGGIIGTLFKLFCSSWLNRMNEEDARDRRQNRNNPNKEENR